MATERFRVRVPAIIWEVVEIKVATDEPMDSRSLKALLTLRDGSNIEIHDLISRAKLGTHASLGYTVTPLDVEGLGLAGVPAFEAERVWVERSAIHEASDLFGADVEVERIAAEPLRPDKLLPEPFDWEAL